LNERPLVTGKRGKATHNSAVATEGERTALIVGEAEKRGGRECREGRGIRPERIGNLWVS